MNHISRLRNFQNIQNLNTFKNEVKTYLFNKPQSSAKISTFILEALFCFKRFSMDHINGNVPFQGVMHRVSSSRTTASDCTFQPLYV